MSSPVDFALLGQVVGAAAVVIGPVWGARTWLDKRFAKKADLSALEETKADIEQRKRIEEKLFDKLDEHSRRDEELFREMTGRMGEYHAEVMAKLGEKADRR